VAKESSRRQADVVNVAPSVTSTTGKTTLTAAIHARHLRQRRAARAKSFDGDPDNAPEEKERGITIATSQVEYENDKPALRPVDCPGTPTTSRT